MNATQSSPSTLQSASASASSPRPPTLPRTDIEESLGTPQTSNVPRDRNPPLIGTDETIVVGSNSLNNGANTAVPNYVDSRFSCNICLDAVVEPVVTQCGHLYCWPCLYRWLEPGMNLGERHSLGLDIEPQHHQNLPAIDSSRRACPVCKATCSLDSLVPIYIRSTQEVPAPDAPYASSSPSQNISKSDQVPLHGDEHESDASIENALSMDEPIDSNTTNFEDRTISEHIIGSPSDETTGLRQRRNRQQRVATTEINPVPSRPAAISPRASPTSSSPSTPSEFVRGARPPQTLTEGVLLSFQHATMASSSSAAGPTRHGGIPSIHYRRTDGDSAAAAAAAAAAASGYDMQPNATEYLSRLLIMLTSFVVLCLLLL